MKGDDISAVVSTLIEQGAPLTNYQTGKDLKDWSFKPIRAQCYLGAFGIARALEGADIVICGRVADSSPCIALQHGGTDDRETISRSWARPWLLAI